MVVAVDSGGGQNYLEVFVEQARSRAAVRCSKMPMDVVPTSGGMQTLMVRDNTRPAALPWCRSVGGLTAATLDPNDWILAAG